MPRTSFFRRTSQRSDQLANAVRDAKRFRDRRLIKQSKSAGCRDHSALGKFLGITSQGRGFQPRTKRLAESIAFNPGLVGTIP